MGSGGGKDWKPEVGRVRVTDHLYCSLCIYCCVASHRLSEALESSEAAEWVPTTGPCWRQRGRLLMAVESDEVSLQAASSSSGTLVPFSHCPVPTHDTDDRILGTALGVTFFPNL